MFTAAMTATRETAGRCWQGTNHRTAAQRLLIIGATTFGSALLFLAIVAGFAALHLLSR